MTLPLSVTVTVPTGAAPPAATTLPTTLIAEPAEATTLFGAAMIDVATGSRSTSTATERAGTVTVPVAASHAVVLTTASDPFASAGVSANPRPASDEIVCVVA